MASSHPLRLSQANFPQDETPAVDLWLLVPTLSLVSLGVAIVYSVSIPAVASQGTSVLSKLLQEIAFVALSVLGLLAAMRVSMGWLKAKAWALLTVTVVLLAGVLIMPGRNGAHRWYIIPHTPVNFQPSELAKLMLVIVTARYFSHFRQGLSNWREALPPFVVLFLVVGLIAKEPDIGTAAVTAVAMLVCFHIGGAKLRHLVAAGGMAAVPATYLVWKHPYQLARIVSFMRGNEVELAGSYQKVHSLIALGTGGLTGVGYCQGVEKYFYLPAATTDSILATTGEELGMVATWAVLALFAILVWRGMKVASAVPDRFSGLLAAGVTTLIGAQALLNIAVVTGSIPATGVTLPFVSYGGSSLLFSMIGMGLLLNVSRRGSEAASTGSTGEVRVSRS
jgi:cell division protein FtsW